MESKWIRFLRCVFYCIMKPFVWFYVVVFQHVRFRKNGYKLPKGPVLFISNHVTNWDPFYLNCMFFTRIIRFIANDELFKNKYYAWFSKNILGEVCRGKTDESVSDVLAMKRLVKSGATLGLYPEGDIDMFGRTLPIGVSVAKFVKMLGVPVVLTRVQGACIRAPRWADKARHAHITYSVTDIISPREWKTMSVTELYERILRGITVDEFAYQRQLQYKQLLARRRAEWLELGLFYCPHCRQFETLQSKGDKVFCPCGFTARYNRRGMLESVQKPLPWTLLTEWDSAQKRALCEKIEAHTGEQPLLQAEGLDYYRTEKTAYCKKPLAKASLKVYKDRLEVIFDGEETHNIPMYEVKRATLQHKDILDVLCKDCLLRFCTKTRKWSAYLYALAIDKIIGAEKYYLT